MILVDSSVWIDYFRGAPGAEATRERAWDDQLHLNREKAKADSAAVRGAMFREEFVRQSGRERRKGEYPTLPSFRL